MKNNYRNDLKQVTSEFYHFKTYLFVVYWLVSIIPAKVYYSEGAK